MSLQIDPVDGTITLTRGDDQTITFNIVDNTGAPLSLAGSLFFFTVKEDLDDDISAAVFQKSVGNGIVVEPGSVTGKLTVAITSADVAGLANDYVADLLMVDATGKRTTFPTEGAWRFFVPKNVSTSGGVPPVPTPVNPIFPAEILALGGYVLKDLVTGKFWLLTMQNGVPTWNGPNDNYPV